MYNSYYNLTAKPFKIDTDPRFIWFGEIHKEAMANLKYGLLDRNGFIVLTGDVGTGKTTLINALLDTLDGDVRVVKINHPSLEINEFLILVAKTLDPTVALSDKSDLLLFFNSYLQRAHAEGVTVLLVIDEAHRLSIDLLEEIRLLSNIEWAGEKLLNIMLVGQNEIKPMLMKPECRALQQRITSFYDIQTLSRQETRDYIAYRLHMAGHPKPLFTSAAINEVYTISKGNPRVINILCDRAMLTGYVTESLAIDSDIVSECGRELDLAPKEQKGILIKYRPDWRTVRSRLMTFFASTKKWAARISNNVKGGFQGWAAVAHSTCGEMVRFLGEAVRHYQRPNLKKYLPVALAMVFVLLLGTVTIRMMDSGKDTGAPAIGAMQRPEPDRAAMGPRQAHQTDRMLDDKSFFDHFCKSSIYLAAADFLCAVAAPGWAPTREIGFADFREMRATSKQTPMELATVALEQGNPLRAIELIEADTTGPAEEKAKIDEMYAKALVGRAEAIMATAPSEAERLLLKAVDVAPDQARALSMLGKHYTRIQSYDRAIDAYQRFARIDSPASDALFNLGFLYATTGKFEAAEKAFEQVAQLRPAYLDKTLFNLAVVQQNLGKNEASISNLEKVVRIAPENEKALAYLNKLKISSAANGTPLK